MNAIIEIKFPRAVCVDLYRENKVLGRFMLRYSGKTLAAGVVTEVCISCSHLTCCFLANRSSRFRTLVFT